ncbi:NepR family anti-sigma factor [Methylocapsa acidiphila]|uniref:NepR family anti-sigma factor n=1 Tax=Methylocapsa acidiphila TaxID=133552 RepID=UPI00056532D6|nr:NepR family anti-sigma factor [Methylocapsa acidiphila]
MKDKESQSNGGQVTKATKSGGTINKGIESLADAALGEKCPSMQLQEAEGANALTSPRAKRGVPKNDITEQIGLGLRSVYEDVLAQPVPDRFFELLRQLETAGAHSKKGAT